MAYAPLVLDPGVPESLQAFVGERVEPVLKQVRALLALPVAPDASDASAAPGVEWVVAPALFAVLGGLSQVFFNSQSSGKLSFLAVAERYPAEHEPGNAIKDPKKFADLLYVHHRASLVHGLGLNLQRDGRFEPWRVAPLAIDGKPTRLKLARTRALPVMENFLTALESNSGGVAGAGPTLSFTADGLRLELDAFYCGVRRVARRLAEDVTLQPGALRVLQPWFVELQHWENDRVSGLLSANADRAPSTERTTVLARAPATAVARHPH